jgi:hypothetical protein
MGHGIVIGGDQVISCAATNLPFYFDQLMAVANALQYNLNIFVGTNEYKNTNE